MMKGDPKATAMRLKKVVTALRTISDLLMNLDGSVTVEEER